MGQQSSMSGVHFPSRSPAFRLAVLALVAVVMSVAASFLVVQWLRPAEGSAAPGSESKAAPAVLFGGWPKEGPDVVKKPDLLLLLSGQEHGYLQPCGCSRPQLGGLVRRYNLLKDLTQKREWPVLAVDVGDVIDNADHRGPQTMLKYRTSMQALKMMNYLAVSVGQYETAAPTLLDVIAEYALQPNNAQPPLLCSNLMSKGDFANAVQSWVISGSRDGSPKVGVVSIIGPSVGKKIPTQNPPVRFAPTDQVLRDGLKALMPQKPELLVLLYQGTFKEAESCANHFPEFNVILCLTEEAEPPATPARVKDTLIVGVGHKGRFVGLVGAYRTGNARQPFHLYYQLASLGEEYETSADKVAGHPIMELMETYAKEVRDKHYLDKYPQRKHPVQVDFPEATYVGSERCKKCHEQAYRVWEKSPHSHAYKTLAGATKPGLRQFDGECIVCHTTGFAYESGYKNEETTAHLKNVGCESCHGPASLHVKDTLRGANKQKLLALMNPFKPQPGETQPLMTARLNLIDQACQKCHDIDNDVHWDFKHRWPRIVHGEQGGAPRGKDPFTVP